MTLPRHIERRDLAIQQCREANAAADNSLGRYELACAEVDWLVAKQLYENDLAATGGETNWSENPEGENGFRIGR